MTAATSGGPPKEDAGPATGPAPNTTRTVDSRKSSVTAGVVAGLHRRRGASQRLPRLDCGCCADPYTNRHRPRPRGYRDAVEHLADRGLCAAPDLDALRQMYKAGGRDRELAAAVADAWDVAG